MSPNEPVRPGRAQWAALILFAGASGAVDVLAFIALGRVFAGVMTGNLVLLGLSFTGTGGEGGSAAPLLALAGYVAGVAVVAPFTRRRQGEPETRWPRAVVGWLAAEVALLAAVAAGWAAADGAPAQPWLDVVLVAVAVAMGVQSAAPAPRAPGASASRTWAPWPGSSPSPRARRRPRWCTRRRRRGRWPSRCSGRWWHWRA
ncbi:DUF1275 family protein [Streptomyces sp. NP-1717]|uniref:DUF1275 family protein n=1 Tax=Streptomyces sp. NP-1717 TaxID=2704470 RepID=UPI001F5C1CB3|nr:YoaK family protein [Streptomyces sp. NP-1717]MCI3224692.1 DUF1275 domain-containing protein [Streptomyces sp. NP-1717]